MQIYVNVNITIVVELEKSCNLSGSSIRDECKLKVEGRARHPVKRSECSQFCGASSKTSDLLRAMFSVMQMDLCPAMVQYSSSPAAAAELRQRLAQPKLRQVLGVNAHYVLDPTK